MLDVHFWPFASRRVHWRLLLEADRTSSGHDLIDVTDPKRSLLE
jgi:hypothetical protein